MAPSRKNGDQEIKSASLAWAAAQQALPVAVAKLTLALRRVGSLGESRHGQGQHGDDGGQDTHLEQGEFDSAGGRSGRAWDGGEEQLGGSQLEEKSPFMVRADENCARPPPNQCQNLSPSILQLEIEIGTGSIKRPQTYC